MTLTLVHHDRPWTENAQRRWHPHERARKVREWRDAFHVLALEANRRRLGPVAVVAAPRLRDRRAQDVGACFPAVKAAIDGLVDARWLHDDGPDQVVSLTFLAPALGTEDALVLSVTELDEGAA